MKTTNSIVFCLLVIMGGGITYANDGIYSAEIGWDGGAWPSALNYQFQGEPEDICWKKWQLSWEGHGYSYIGYEATDDKNGRCLIDLHRVPRIHIIGRPAKRTICKYGDTPVTSLAYNSSGTITYGTSEYLPGASYNLWIGLYDDPGLQCVEPVKDRTCPVEKSAASSSEQTTKINNPIDCTTGVKVQVETDYVGRGPHSLSYSRTYQSHDARGGGITGKWYTVDDLQLDHLVAVPSVRAEYLRIRFANGSTIHFTLSGGIWIADRQSKGSITSIGSDWEYTTDSGTKFRFDANGALQNKTARTGEVTTYTRIQVGPAQGNIDTITNSFGRTIQFQYDELGQRSVMIDPDGKLYQYGYDAEGRLISVMYPDDTPSDPTDNPIRTYVYEHPIYTKGLTGIIDENGDRFATWGYSSGRAVSTEHANGTDKATLNYLNAYTTEVTFNPGEEKQYTQTYHHTVLNGADKLTKVERQTCDTCLVETQEWTYDNNGYKNSFKDWNGELTQFVFDIRGLLISRTVATGTPEERTTTTEWHTQYRLPTKITEPGKITEYTYDTQGRQLSRTVRSNP